MANKQRIVSKLELASWMPGLAMLLSYQIRWLPKDVAAGLSVAAVALPVGIAYADLAGVPAVIGIYSAIFPLLAYALFGSSKQLMTGPDAATCIIVAASLGHLAAGDPLRYQALLVVLTLFTGIVYLIAGMFRLGFIANFLSFPILTGFLNGVALLIIVGQMQKLLGVSIDGDHLYQQLWQLLLNLPQTHWATLSLGLGLLGLMIVLKRFLPRLPSALLVVITGILLVNLLQLENHGVAVLGNVPAGIPSLFSVPELAFYEVKQLFRDAVALTLISFTSGILTAKSFAQRNHYEVDANQELVAFGSCNLASGLMQGFPVTGADSRTAVNNDMGGKTQLTGIVAAIAMLVVLFFFTAPLAQVPITALAAVIIISAFGLFDFSALKQLYRMNRVDFWVSVITTAGVLLVGALPGVLVAVALSLIMLLMVNSKPSSARLVRVDELHSFHNQADYPAIPFVPGLMIYRFESDILFFNCDHFKTDLLARIKQSEDPIRWVVLDASPINIVDSTATGKLDELLQLLSEQQIEFFVVNKRNSVQRFFDDRWLEQQNDQYIYRFDTLKQAERTYKAEYLAGSPESM